MDFEDYKNQAMVTLNKDLNKDEILLNALMGLSGESGECIDLLKKHLFQGHSLNKEDLKNELGDVLWYIAEASYALDVPLEDIASGNIAKLRKRYPEGFDKEKSIHRTK